MSSSENEQTTPANGQNHQFFFDVKPEVSTEVKTQKKRRTKTGLTATSALIIGSLLGGAIGGGAGVVGFLVSTRPVPVVVNNSETVDWVTGAAAKALPSVVTVSVSSATSGGNGSGVILTSDGYILTNNHVVTLDGESANPLLQVKTSDGHIFDATIVGTDPNNDLAVIKVSAPMALTPIDFADSDAINVGDSVVALGAPLGLEASVTSGIVSALDRTIQLTAPKSSGGASALQWWNGSGPAPVSMKAIQTDASINPGNSGGALVNAKGELVGINVAIGTAGGSGFSGQSGSIGVGFAIPANVAKRIGEELRTTGKASHGMFGAMVSDRSSQKSQIEAFATGALVRELVQGGPAAKAGIQVGDVIVSFNGKPIFNAAELTASVRYLPAGSKVTATVERAGKQLEISVTLGDLVNLK